MKIALSLLAALLASPWAHQAIAANGGRCLSPQSVSLSWNGEHVSKWIVTENEIKQVELPNGYSLGIKIGATSEDHTVEISLYDMNTSEATQLTRTYGGTNSQQGYGARGGADRVEELGTPGILLELTKPDCD
ncbi:hypothetical protein H4F99_14100 [Lysobacter sp. SG-8]|uniref:Uncharacterized protein n=1 Tax=Marilutibacter penaei TaxID=2759900 RepID=A0A7W3YFK7_9GAMM|nr:hypothetical protein [Lysobacter penaei]MBB1089613.1 hypothetical protein [Lysobacter penaei]